MADKKPLEISPEKRARIQRQQLAAEEGARALAEVQREAIAIRTNMERLRALREARDAEAAKHAETASTAAAPKTARRVKRIVR
ncbi:hypothetical protein AS156_16765 [Bradyrhizobium macuxiense]|uniref:Uncharacterized protein n=1 Tax=Bradyrhizobium macuxiense TaxID=1755647 RepID=A0A109JHL8_9BRAD|nr:hypothetical protein [Bradyrhizobium macuxiense]KWV48985.1 hypothetical protein AS156_16765 [Bradyrhizobium macuxiense]